MSINTHLNFFQQIIHKMDEAKNVISLKVDNAYSAALVCVSNSVTMSQCLFCQVTMFKTPGQYDPSDLSTCDLDITADVERLRVMIVFRFLSRVQVLLHTLLHTFYMYGGVCGLSDSYTEGCDTVPAAAETRPDCH